MTYFHFALELAALCLLAISPRSIFAQESSPKPRLLIGVIGGYNEVAYTSKPFGASGTLPGYESFQNGDGTTGFFGASSGLPLSKGNQWFLIAEIAYYNYSGRFTEFRETSFQTGTRSEVSNFADLKYLLFSIGAKLNLFQDPDHPSGLGIQVTASLGKTLASTFTFMNYRTLDANGQLLSSAGESSTASIDGINPFRFAIRPELTYDLPLFERWVVTPAVGVDIPLTKVDGTNRNWTAKSVFLSVALRYCIF